MIKKVVVLGPESTGKSTLCSQLAAHFKTSWVKEYAREYLLTNGTEYSFDHLLDIAKGQLKLEEEAIKLLQPDVNAPALIEDKNLRLILLIPICML